MLKQRRLYIYNLVAGSIPGEGRIATKVRRALLRWCGCEVGHNVCIGQYAKFRGCGRMEIGNNVLIASGVYLQSEGYLKIEDNAEILYKSLLAANGGSTLTVGHHTRIAHCVSIKTTGHEIDTTGPCIAGKTCYHDITVGAGCWICAGSILTPGVHIEDRCVVAAGAVVLENTAHKKGSLLAGVPAKVKKNYLEGGCCVC